MEPRVSLVPLGVSDLARRRLLPRATYRLVKAHCGAVQRLNTPSGRQPLWA